MTKKQVLFWRFTLILILLLGVFFLIKNILEDKNIYQIMKIPKIEKNIDDNKSDDKNFKKEIELNIRPDDFLKKNIDKN